MPDSRKKIFDFWQELKRRKVVRVITVYAAAAFVILELTDIVAPSLGLPDWTLNFIIILLSVGFIIAIILSWIYDIHPEGGIVKTEAAHHDKSEDNRASSKVWKIASYISFVIIVALIILNIIPRSSRSEVKEIIDKSIAVLPFINDSPDEENAYFINGTMEAILDNLCKIEDLRVVGRTSVEQYRNAPKPITEIAKEMNVSYILEGSGQKDGNKVRITLQLIDGINDKHLWSSPYIREIEIGQIFDLQSEIAQLVAAEIEAVITPEEKQLIEKIPTTNLTAYDFYQRGRDEHWRYWLEDDKEVLERAENLYRKALEYDSTFAQAYTGLADVFWDKHYWRDYFSEAFLDTFLILTNIALSYDDQLAEAYRNRGAYYEGIGKPDQALKEYNKALDYNPNDWMGYRDIAGLYDDEPIKQIENYEKALSLNHGPRLPYSLKNLGYAYLSSGFIEKAKYYGQESFALDGDTASYLNFLVFTEFSLENFEKSLDIGRKLLKLDSTYLYPIIFNLTGNHQELYSYYTKHLKEFQESSWILLNSHRIGVALWKLGEYEKAENHFNLQVKYSFESIELGRQIETSKFAHYDLSAAYAWLGDKQKAFHYLNEFNKRRFIPLWLVVQLKIDPLFETIRDEPEYQQIVKDFEAKYQAEHERVRMWLVENDML